MNRKSGKEKRSRYWQHKSCTSGRHAPRDGWYGPHDMGSEISEVEYRAFLAKIYGHPFPGQVRTAKG